ncbi:dipeptidase [candidate division KSB1 bacterium]|nr:dipeptidase [candidate division KSB1 bacterium]
MKSFTPILFALIFNFLACQQKPTPNPIPKALSDAELKEKANRLAHEFIIVDTHVDVPYRLQEKMADISQRTDDGNFDYVRAKAGGLNAPFMSIYVPADYEAKGGAKKLADKLIDMVEKFEKDSPDKFAVAKSVADVQAQFAKGLISLPMGMENGSPIESKLENLRHFYDRGIRYITLAHSKSNHISDSSYDSNRRWKGLSPFGKEVVAEMNRLGIMIDVSHVSDLTFYQVIRLSQAPVIASHSSCRHFTPGWERNMDDEMIKALAKNGGVININFGSSFLNDSIRVAEDKMWKYIQANKINPNSDAGKAALKKFRIENNIGYAGISDVIAHIDHVIKLVGVDHVGFGSDFDGVGDTLPTGLKSVADYPNIIYELLKKGYSDEDIQKICSGNLLRVWSEVEKVAQKLRASND